MQKTTVVNAGRKLNLDEIFAGEVEWDKYGQKGHFSLNTFSRVKLAANPNMYNGTELHDFFSFGGWTAEGSGRIVDGGDKVQGPHAYVFGLGITLSNRQEPDDIAYLIEIGSELTFAGTTYKVVSNRYKGLELEVMKEGE
jgi:hypothetical protein